MVLCVAEDGNLQVSFVLSLWKGGVKKKRLSASRCAIESLGAFRAVSLSQSKDGQF